MTIRTCKTRLSAAAAFIAGNKEKANRMAEKGLFDKFRKTKICWNGCDGYETVESLIQGGYNIVGDKLYKGSQHFDAFAVVEVPWEDVPIDPDGDPDFTGLYVTEDRRVWKE